jgi:enamine deaminase RidA (YjgF/YER057c/UK114 family)
MKLLQTTLLLGLFVILSCGPQEKQSDMDQEPITMETPPADYDPEARLSELGIELPTPSTPVANYVNVVRVGNLVFLAGKGPKKADGQYITGKIGGDLTVEEGYEAARLAGISQLAVLKAELGNLNKVKRIVKVLGMVNANPDFTDQPEVVNGFSDLMVEVFGQRGKHARAAVGMGSLPRGIAVEVEAVVEVYE